MGKKKLELTAKDVVNLPDEEFAKLFENDKFLNNLNNAYAMLPESDRIRVADLWGMSEDEVKKALSTEKPFVKTGQEKRKRGEEEEGDDGVQDDDTMDGEAEEWDTTDGEAEEEDTTDGESEEEDTMDGEVGEENITDDGAEEKDMDKAVKSK